MPEAQELLREGLGGSVAGFVAVVGDEDVLDGLALEEGEVVGGEALDAVARRDVAEAGATRR